MDGPPRRAGPRLAAHRRPDQGRPPPFLPRRPASSRTRAGAVSCRRSIWCRWTAAPPMRLTYWGSADTQVCGWSPPDKDGHSDILAVASHGQPFSYFTWAYKVPTDGDPGGALPWGPVAAIQVADLDGEHKTLLLTGTPPHEPASWKRYRGGATGLLRGYTDGACSPISTATSTPPCSSAAVSPSSPTTRASGTCTRARTTAGTCAATPTTTPSTPGTPPATAPGSSTSAPGTCGSSKTCPRTRSRAASTSASAARARDAVRTRCPRRSTWTASRSTRRAGPAPSSYAAACTGSPTATAPRAPSRTPPAYASGSPRCWAPAAGSPTSPTRTARTPSRSPSSPGPPASASRAASPPANWGACWRWSPTRRANASRSPRTTDAC